MHRRSKSLTHGVVLAAGFALVGCQHDGTAPGQSTQALSTPEALAIGRETAGEVQTVAAGFTVGDLFLFGFSGVGGVSGPFASSTLSPTAACPTVTPFPPVDSDSDRVPDDVTLSFTLPDCRFSHDGGVFEVTGTIHITDPTPTVRDIGHRVEFGDLQRKFTAADGSFFLHRLNGVSQVLQSASTFSGSDSTTSSFESSHDTSSLAKAWAVNFVADAGAASVGEDHHLPSGTFTVDGSTTRMHEGVTRSLAVQTVTPLHFDAGCMAEQKFTAGELIITRTGGEHSGTIHVTFTGCGVDPTITVSTT